LNWRNKTDKNDFLQKTSIISNDHSLIVETNKKSDMIKRSNKKVDITLTTRLIELKNLEEIIGVRKKKARFIDFYFSLLMQKNSE